MLVVGELGDQAADDSGHRVTVLFAPGSARNAGNGVTPGSTVWFVPADFLSDAQVAAYGRFAGVPSRPELERFFFLDGRGLELIAGRRGDHSRLGLAVQIGTVRYLGRFLEDPLDVPWPVVEYLAGQLGIADASCVKAYADRPKTAYEHAWEIRRTYGYRPFEDVEATASFRAFLEGRAWTHAEGPAALFARAVSWLRRERVVLPGVSVLTRLVSQVRDAAATRLYVMLAEAATSADPMLPARLHGLLQVSDRARFSELERLRRSPRRNSGPEMVRALDRVNELAGIGAGAVDVTTVPANRLAALARYGLGSKAVAVAELAEPRRTATLVAVARHLEATAVDDALDVFDQLMATRLISPARRASQAERLAALPRLEKTSRMLARANHAIEGVLAAAEDRGGGLDVTAVWEGVEHVAPWEQVAASAAVIDELVPDDNDGADAAMRAQLADRYRTVRPFLELLGAAPVLNAAAAGRRVLAAVRALPELSRRRVRRNPVDRGTLKIAAIWATVFSPPSYSCWAKTAWSGVSFGRRPPARPRARAAARPSRVLATISSRCNSASTDSMPNMARPSTVVVSMPCSVTFRPMPRPRSSAPRVIRCSTERDSRSRRVMTSVSPSRNSCSTRSSSGRDAFAPEAVSM